MGTRTLVIACGFALIAVITAAGGAQAQTRTNQSNAEIFKWDQSMWDIELRPISSHVCFLTAAHGDLDQHAALGVHHSTIDLKEGYHWAQVVGGGNTQHNDSGKVWKLGGWGEEVGGGAVCVPMQDFIVDQGGWRELSPLGRAWVTTPWGLSCRVHRSRVNMWPANSITYISGFRAGFYGSSSRIEVLNASRLDEPVPGEVATSNCDVVNFEAHFYSFFAGLPDMAPSLARFKQPDGRYSSRMDVDAGQDQIEQSYLIPTREGVCYLTKINGDFRGNGEGVRIYTDVWEGTEYWVVEARAVDGEAHASVQCLNYDQRAPEITGPQ